MYSKLIYKYNKYILMIKGEKLDSIKVLFKSYIN